MKDKITDAIIWCALLLSIAIAIYTFPAEADTKDTKCYATCHQFESALLVGCYLSDFEGRKEPNMKKRLKNFERHEKYCQDLAKETMGKDSGCKEE